MAVKVIGLVAAVMNKVSILDPVQLSANKSIVSVNPCVE
jgi:hypothetical protein